MTFEELEIGKHFRQKNSHIIYKKVSDIGKFFNAKEVGSDRRLSIPLKRNIIPLDLEIKS